MAPTASTRRNSEALRWLRAGVFAGVTLMALRPTGFYPAALDALLSLTAATLALFSPGLGILAFVVALSVPLMAADLVVGGLFLVVGFVAIQYLAQDDAASFVVIALAFVAARYGLGWAVVALAGYMLGTAEGAVAALVACLAIEASGILLGRETAGMLATGGAPPGLVSFGGIEDPLKFGWVPDAVRSVAPGELVGALASAKHVALLIAQPLLWAGGAAVAGSLRRPARAPKRLAFGFMAVGAAVAALAVTGVIAMAASQGPVPADKLVAAGGMSLVVALIGVAVWESVFPPAPIAEPALVATSSMNAEDADVDELLRLIASAEEELASKHTVQGVVMITDMKSFSKMTEEEGSVISAKLIQRHRDLLLPVIAEHGGKGKSTGGDGLVAAFEDARQALAAAIKMQRALDEYNATGSGEREMWIRIGIAHGEIVLDKGGRPFIGAALNQAARVMNLGDGGQVMVADDVVGWAGRDTFNACSHGRYALKNIAEPVEVFELLWADGQEPKPPPFEGQG